MQGGSESNLQCCSGHFARTLLLRPAMDDTRRDEFLHNAQAELLQQWRCSTPDLLALPFADSFSGAAPVHADLALLARKADEAVRGEALGLFSPALPVCHCASVPLRQCGAPTEPTKHAALPPLRRPSVRPQSRFNAQHQHASHERRHRQPHHHAPQEPPAGALRPPARRHTTLRPTARPPAAHAALPPSLLPLPPLQLLPAVLVRLPLHVRSAAGLPAGPAPAAAAAAAAAAGPARHSAGTCRARRA